MIDRSGIARFAQRFLGRQARTSHTQPARRLRLESLEDRRMLSGTPYSPSSESELPLTEIHSAVDSLSASKLSDVHERQMAPASVSVWLFQSFEPMEVYGTDHDDTIEITAMEDGYEIVINADEAVRSTARYIRLHCGGGRDVVVLRAGELDDTLVIEPDSALVTRRACSSTPDGRGRDYYDQEFKITDAEDFTIFSEGGYDVATFFDSADNDTFVGKADYAAMHGDGYHHRVHGFAEVRAESTEGGQDVARFYDSPGDDTFVTTPESAELSGELAGGAFRVEAEGFQAVHAFATAGGTDTAEFHDSPGDDQNVSTPTCAVLYGDGFYNRAKFFENTCAYSTEGTDVAKLYDSRADDEFVASPDHAALFNPDYVEQYTHGFCNVAKNFAGAHAYAAAGGTDVAKLFDSPEDDRFVADPDQGALFRPGQYYNRAKFFDAVHAFSTAGGTDVARMRGSQGSDTYHIGSEHAAVFQPGHYYNRAKFFDEIYRDDANPQLDILTGDQLVPVGNNSEAGSLVIRDIQAILAIDLEPDSSEKLWNWWSRDFNGDYIVDGLDVFGMLAAGVGNTLSQDSPSYAPVEVLMYTEDYHGPDYPPGEAGMLRIRSEGVPVNGYAIKSSEDAFTGDSAANLGWFVEDIDNQISGCMGFQIDGEHSLGDVVGDEWDLTAVHIDLTFLYTIEGMLGTYKGNVILVGDLPPEPDDRPSLQLPQSGGGSLGGIFLTRDNMGGGPGISDAESTQVRLFQAPDGDTSGDAILDTDDIFSLLSDGSLSQEEGWDWTQDQTDGSTDIEPEDIFTILATGTWQG